MRGKVEWLSQLLEFGKLPRANRNSEIGNRKSPWLCNISTPQSEIILAARPLPADHSVSPLASVLQSQVGNWKSKILLALAAGWYALLQC